VATIARRQKTPRVKVTATEGKPGLSLAHPDPIYGHSLLMKAIGTDDVDFCGQLLSQLASASVQDGEVNEQKLNFMLAVVKGIQPKDQLETLLAAQMAAVHSLTMNMAGRMADVSILPQMEVVGRLLNNLARTYALQMEALKRHRSTGEQKVTVEHVTVNDGGKAMFAIGNLGQGDKATQGGEGSYGKPETAP
jgi:hypothetical protein